MEISKYKGLTEKEASERVSLGLSNSSIDTRTPSYLEIFFRHFFAISNLALIPLLIALAFFSVYRDVFVLSFFLITSALTQTIEEVNVKKRLEKLKDRFKSTGKVIRNSELREILSSEIVKDDIVVANEGDTILADGEILGAEFLQIDESALTGESDYITKQEKDEVLSGSFVVTGICIYKVKKIGKNNYLNRLAKESTTFVRKESQLEKNSTKLVYIFTAIGFITASLNFIFARINGYEVKEILIGITTIMGNITPQMLLIILLVTFVVSVAKLANKGILIQKKGAIDELASIDIVCMDKTGTITTNEMNVKEDYFNNISKSELKEFFSPIYKNLYGINKTAKSIFDYLELDDAKELSKKDHFDQVPFTSDKKYSLYEYKNRSVGLGAYSKLKTYIYENHQKEAEKIIESFSSKGYRVIFGFITNHKIINSNKNIKTDNFFVLGINEDLNPGIVNVLKSLKRQNIEVKIISGDSLESVKRVAEKVGISTDNIIDLSQNDRDLSEIIIDTIVFTRAVPSDKNKIVNILKEKGLKVAMIGDGVNDVLGLKNSDVSIAMETGAKVARDVSDIVLLKNDYKKIPEIFYEGDNIIFNVKLTAKLYFSRAVIYGMIALFFTFVIGSFVPINPTSTLISSFLGNTLVSYLLTYSRDEVRDQRSFMKDILLSSVPTGILISIFSIFIYYVNRTSLSQIELNTAIILGVLGMSMSYSLFLLWRSGKFAKNIFLLIGTFLFGMYIGIMQTILPIWRIDNFYDQVLVSTLLGIGCLIIFLIIRLNKSFAKIKNIKVISYIVPLLIFLGGISMPVRTYYAVWPVPFESYFSIFLAIGVFILMMIAVHLLIIDQLMRLDINKSTFYQER